MMDRSAEESEKSERMRMKKPAYVLRRDYGAAELKRVYGTNLMRGLRYSVALNLVAVGCYWGIYSLEPHTEAQAVTVRLTKYEELVPPPRLTDKNFGLSAYPVLSQSSGANTVHALPVRHPGPRNNRVKRAPLAARGYGDIQRELPSAPGANKIDPSKFLADNSNPEGTTAYDELNTSGAGGNSDERFRGGNLVASREGLVPSGNARSGVGTNIHDVLGGEGDNGGGQGGDADRFGNGSGGSFGFSMSWLQGGMRRKLSGALPEYPAGVNIEAQVGIRAVVSPNGSVKSVQPVQKANSKLEQAAMKELRFWKFEPLRSSAPQIDQTCVVTFNFKLK